MPIVSFVNASGWLAGFGTADLNALADNSLKSSTIAALDNVSLGAPFAQFEVSLAALTPGAGANVVCILLPETSTGGTFVTSADGTSAGVQARWTNYPYFIVSLTQGGSQAQVQQSPAIPVLNQRYRPALLNRAKTPLALSGNQVNVRFIYEQVA